MKVDTMSAIKKNGRGRIARGFNRFRQWLRSGKKQFQPRLVFGYTAEADIYVIPFKGQKRVFRVQHPQYPDSEERQRQQAQKKFLQQAIFHWLFPKNSITPIGVSQVAIDGKKQWGFVSEPVKNRSNDYRAYQNAFYKGTNQNPAAAERHRQFALAVRRQVVERVWKETGIALSNKPTNICNVNGNPVFFEIDSISLPRLSRFLEISPVTPRQRNQLKRLVQQLKKTP